MIVLLIGCSKVSSPDALVSQWLHSSEDKNSVHRKLASTNNRQCMKGIFSVETLKAEIKQIEKPFLKLESVEGTWKHIDLSSLPIPQANFLNRYGEEIGDLSNTEAIDYSDCSDLPCIFNKIYGQDDSVAGYVHYLWYLKFGHMLSLDNHVPKQVSKNAGEFNNKKFPLKSYLFNQEELYGFWRLTHLLKSPHNNISSMKQIQKVPRGEKFEESDFSTACGLAHNSGWIKLTDKCLVFSKDQNNGLFYTSVMHELSHQIDYEEGRRLFKASHRSQQKDYLDISGFYLHEYKDKKNIIQRRWLKRPDVKLITPYSGMTPQENFAEVLSFFRLDGEKTLQKITLPHFKFTSKGYYRGKDFKQRSLFKMWLDQYASFIEKRAAQVFSECTNKKKCQDERSREIEQDLRGQIMLAEPEGCSVFDDRPIMDAWKNEISHRLGLIYQRHNTAYAKNKMYVAQGHFAPRIGVDAFLECYGEKNESACYALAVKDNISEEDSSELYLSYYPYAKVRTDLMIAYQRLASSRLGAAYKSAQNVWNNCRRVKPDDIEVPVGEIFLLSEGYMVSSLYNCLNTQIPEGVKSVVREMNVKVSKEELILTSELRPLVVKAMQEIYEKEKSKEVMIAKKMIVKIRGQVNGKTNCKTMALSLFSFEPVFHLKQELFEEHLEKSVCD